MTGPDIPTLTVGADLPPPPPPDLRAVAAEALAHLPGPPPLTLLVNDPQRDTPTHAVLAALAGQTDLSAARVLVATGTHRFGDADRAAFETSLRARLRLGAIAWHDCQAPDLAPLAGRYRIHPWLLDDRPVLAIGSVEPHYFAGFTGAHKTATIGCLSHEDIQANHRHALSPHCRPGRLEGNPVYDALVEMVRTLVSVRPITTINLAQKDGRLLASATGEPLESLHRLTPTVEAAFIARVERPLPGLVLEVDGALGVSFYQAEKAIKNSEWAVADAGFMVLHAPCRAGIGQDHFVSLLRQAPTYAEALARVHARGYRLGDHKAVRLRYLTDPSCRNVRVYVVSDGLSDDDATTLGLLKASSVAEALAAARQGPGDGPVYRLPDAANCCLLPAEV